MRSVLLTAALAATLLVGCASPIVIDDPEHALVTSTVDARSVPGFVADEQRPDDVITDFDVAGLGVDPASTRYQGEWTDVGYLPDVNRFHVYLGVAGKYTVHVITVPVDRPEEWGSGSSSGNSVIGLGDPTTLQYLPHGSSSAPEGWHSLSEWMIVKD
jgi:hypothetical protein